jgi:D-glycero-D-manno-heptose 1,7-bisphosphate phosphatase
MYSPGEPTDRTPAQRRPAVFLDRDGTIVEDVGYLSGPEQLVLLPRSAEAIARLNAAKVPVVVVTNQAGVARGYFSESRVREVHLRLDQLLAERSARIDRYYFCPHHPDAGDGPYRRVCECRKPRPGLLLQAAAELEIDLSRSFMIGDKRSDLDAGAAAGTRTVLVRTGYGGDVERSGDLPAAGFLGVCDQLAEAVDLCLTHCQT